MALPRPLLPKWINDFCAPVVVTIATAEVENICMKNGLLLHELLNAFNKLNNVNATIKSTYNQIDITDANIRFERSSEVRMKSPSGVEELLRSSYEEYDMNKIPNNLTDLKIAPPSTWGNKTEQIVLRSMSFRLVRLYTVL